MLELQNIKITKFLNFVTLAYMIKKKNSLRMMYKHQNM